MPFARVKDTKSAVIVDFAPAPTGPAAMLASPPILNVLAMTSHAPLRKSRPQSLRDEAYDETYLVPALSSGNTNDVRATSRQHFATLKLNASLLKEAAR